MAIAQAPEFQIVFRNPLAKLRVLLFGHIGLLESYFDGDMEVEGDLRAALAEGLRRPAHGMTPLVRVRNWWHEVVHSNASWECAKDNARFHYGLGADFYK